ncbi:MAG: hypothetical protein RI885_150 [Actinomycetota bacterium]|jgi:hypothetical protein
MSTRPKTSPRGRPFPRVPGVAVGIAIVALGANTFVLPGLQARSADPLGLLWWLVPIAFSGIAVAATWFVPLLSARRLRKALESQRGIRPRELSFLAVVGSHPRGEVFVVSADHVSWRITAVAGSTETGNWIDTKAPTIVDAPNGSFLSIGELAASRGGRVYPLKDDGFQFMKPKDLETLLIALGRLASRSSSKESREQPRSCD